MKVIAKINKRITQRQIDYICGLLLHNELIWLDYKDEGFAMLIDDGFIDFSNTAADTGTTK